MSSSKKSQNYQYSNNPNDSTKTSQIANAFNNNS